MSSYTSSGIAAVLSFFLPGLGHIYDGRILKGFCLLIFFLILIGLAWQVTIYPIVGQNTEVIGWKTEISEVEQNLRTDRMKLAATQDPEMRRRLRILIESEEELLKLAKINLSWAESEQPEPYTFPLIAMFMVMAVALWIYGIVNAYKTAERMNEIKDKGKIISGKKNNLCVGCWLSGDCERENKSKKSRQIITNCQAYFPKSK